ncbi:hypothetical protein E2C01_080679 [Portunus trituberculatus]|uniref:Uncharacterized protein n=1 Tax=Portunus trituberculatus TaxID=210409 RepID=A0A5B7IMT9_PORTR|nr:hypothetical protein [Portunus trituberculatus]
MEQQQQQQQQGREGFLSTSLNQMPPPPCSTTQHHLHHTVLRAVRRHLHGGILKKGRGVRAARRPRPAPGSCPEPAETRRISGKNPVSLRLHIAIQ